MLKGGLCPQTQVHQVAGEAIERARRGEGPTLIEAQTYRFRGHSLADPDELRSKEEKDKWLVRPHPIRTSGWCTPPPGGTRKNFPDLPCPHPIPGPCSLSPSRAHTKITPRDMTHATCSRQLVALLIARCPDL